MKPSWFDATIVPILAISATVLLNTAPGYCDQQAVFDLIINQVPQGEVLIILREQDVLVRTADLERAGLQQIKGREETLKGERFISLVSLAPGVSYTLNSEQFTLNLTVAAAYLPSNVRDLRLNVRPTGIRYTQDSSFFLNYGISSRNFEQVNASTEMGLSIGNTLLYSGLNLTSDGKLVRGLTNVTLDNPQTQTRWVFGDRSVQTGELGGGALIGGMTYASEWSLDPYVVRTPSFNTLTGVVTSPATADIYVNNQLIRREELPPGEFNLQNLPFAIGSNDARVILRDAFGREQTYSYSYYVPARLLAAGQAEFNYSLGFQRTNLSQDSWGYGAPMFLGWHRLGLDDTFTVGGRLEASSTLISGGANLISRLPFGELGIVVGASSAEGLQGTAATISFGTSGKSIGFNTSLRLVSPYYANISLRPQDDRAELEVGVGSSVALSSQVGLYARYTYSDWRDRGILETYTLGSNMTLNPQLLLTVSLSQSNQTARASDTTLLLSLNYFFGNSTTARLLQQFQNNQGTTTAEVQKPLSLSSEIGYRIQSQLAREQLNHYGQLQYQAPFGLYTLDLYQNNQQTSFNLTAAGSMVMINDQIFWSRPLTSSFAVLEVPGVANVQGYLNNQRIGETDGRGMLLLPNLQPYYGNRISVAADDLPIDYTINSTEQIVAPPYRGGSIVRFAAQKIQIILGTLQLQIGNKPVIPSYGQLSVKVQDQPVTSPLGGKGEFYLENISAGNYAAEVESRDGLCKFTLTIPNTTESIIKLGKITCFLPDTPNASPQP